MRIKALIITIIVMVMCGGIVVADTPSIFDIGILNYYSISDVTEIDQTIANYTPGVRMQMNITPWFGLSGDVLLQSPFAGGDALLFTISTDIAFRAPLGLFEPFLALGPAYRLVLDDSGLALQQTLLYSARAGFDFNITPVFALGLEANLFVPDMTALFDVATYTADYFMDNTLVGLVMKVRL